MELSSAVFESVGALLEWGCGKLSGNEGFSVLAITHHAEGKRGASYCLEDVQTAINRAFEEIRNCGGIEAYVIAYHVTLNLESGPQQGFLFEAEARNSDCRAILFHPIRREPTGAYCATGEYTLLETDEKVIKPPQ